MAISPTKKLLAMMSDTTALAKVDGMKLASTVNRAVIAAFKYAERMGEEADEAKRKRQEMAQVLANPDDIHDAQERKAVLEQFEKADKAIATALAKRDEAIGEFNQYMDEQAMLFRSKGQDPMRRYKEMIIPRGEITLPNGRTVTQMVIVKRKVDLTPVDVEDDEHKLSVAAARSDSDRVGLARDMGRGKYNDGHMLFNHEAANFDPGEVASFGSACL